LATNIDHQSQYFSEFKKVKDIHWQ